MTTNSTTSDQYRKRREAAAASRLETRQRLLASADLAFRTRGYAQSSVAGIAKDAGVALQTLYLAWGSKHALLRGATEAAASGASTPSSPGQWHDAVVSSVTERSGPAANATEYLEAFAEVFVDVALRTAEYWKINRDAAAVDPDAAASWTVTLKARRETMRAIAEHIPVAGLNPTLDTQQIADTLWAIASPDSYLLLTTGGDYTLDEYQEWLARTITGALTASTPV